MLIDLDKFKRVNDQYGHDIGDRLLAKFSARVLSSLEADEYLIRLGGEEFLVLGALRSERRSLELAGKIRESMCERPFDLMRDVSLDITCSIGLAYGEVTSENNVVELIKKADLAMYQAKREGRNRVVGSQLRK